MSVQNAYEAIMIFSLKDGDEAVAALVEKFKSLVETSATLESIDDWGKRRLAYPINYEEDGYYILINFSADAAFPAELERVSKITDNVIRTLVIKKPEK